MLTYSQALRTLQPVIPSVIGALKEGLGAADQIHERGRFERRRDGHFYAHAARRTAADLLADAGLLAESDEDERPELPLSGLMIRYRSIAMRIYRSQLAPQGDMVIPVPGRSKAKQAFWSQAAALDGMQQENLLLVWRDEDGSLVEPLTMARPVGGDHRRRSLKLSWEGPLSSSMATLRAADLDIMQPAVEYPMLGDKDTG